MTLAEAFSIGEKEVISLVGAGGKTTLLYALGRELSALRSGVILTTTTKIFEPEPSPSFHQFLSPELSAVTKWVMEHLHLPQSLLIARERLLDGKLAGIPPEWVDELISLDGVSTIVAEADGAAGRPLKAPRDGEPVVPGRTTLLVPVMGIDGLGRPLAEETVFRSAIASRLLDLPPGSTVTEEAVARLMVELIKHAPPGARIIPLINKVDLPGGREKAEKLAHAILSLNRPGIRSVVLGQLQHLPTMMAIIAAKPTGFTRSPIIIEEIKAPPGTSPVPVGRPEPSSALLKLHRQDTDKE
jgi:probable selenium-dependent hydroxylase accessory protein YqeC